MPKASVTRQIAREKQKLIDFVLDIEKYPEFIPFCIDSKVYERNDKKDEIAIIADLTIGKKPFVDTYKSDVKFYKDKGLEPDMETIRKIIVRNKGKFVAPTRKLKGESGLSGIIKNYDINDKETKVLLSNKYNNKKPIDYCI